MLARCCFSARPCKRCNYHVIAIKLTSYSDGNLLPGMNSYRSSPKSVTGRIAEFISRTELADIPIKVRETAKLHLVDGLVTMIAGSDDGASCAIRDYIRRLDSRSEATVIGTTKKFAAQHAALANGVQGHVLDYDDSQLATLSSRPFGQQTHPTTPVLASALALAEKMRCTGAHFLTAYIAGVEVACRLGDAVRPSHYLDGFHPTGTFGTFGAAAACAHLLRLDKEHCAWAMGIAGTLASGVRANCGTMTKSLNAGRAAENGVMAATLAQQGFTASENIFEDAMGYFSAACRNQYDPELLFFGNPFFFAQPGIAIKLYPCAVVMHPLLDLLLSLVQRHNIRSDAVERIQVTMPPQSVLPLVYKRPKNSLQAKFSLPFAVAVALADRAAGLAQYTDLKVKDPRVADLMQRTDLLVSKHNATRPAGIRIILKDGRSYCGKTVKKHSASAVSRSKIEKKFRHCAGNKLTPRMIRRLLDYLWSIEAQKSVSDLTRLLRTTRV
jgi:2-methylcitrate dehydratase PrpD